LMIPRGFLVDLLANCKVIGVGFNSPKSSCK
jgi:hypothetical protein